MSVKCLSWAWEKSRARGTDHAVLIAIADSANDDDHQRCWLRIKSLAEKARVSESTARRAVQELVRIGELVIERQASARGDLMANKYRVTMQSDPSCQVDTTHQADTTPCQPDTTPPVRLTPPLVTVGEKPVGLSTARDPFADDEEVHRILGAVEGGAFHLPGPGETEWRAAVITAFRDTHGGKDPSPSMREPWERKARECERGGYDAALITTCMRELMVQAGKGPGLLPHLVAERSVVVPKAVPPPPPTLPPEPETAEELAEQVEREKQNLQALRVQWR